MSELIFDPTFPHLYECEQIGEMPAEIQRYYYPGASTKGGRDGVLVAIRPQHAAAWLGVFAFGLTPGGASGIFSTPDMRRLCVVANGDGYFVAANAPSNWESVGITPITDVRCIRSHSIIVFAGFTELIAYGASGVKWRTKRLAWDAMKLNEVTDSSIEGEFWDMRSDKIESFTVDLATGENRGGVEE